VLLRRLQLWGREAAEAAAASGLQAGAHSLAEFYKPTMRIKLTENALKEALFELERLVGTELKNLMVAELEILSRYAGPPEAVDPGVLLQALASPPSAAFLLPSQLEMLHSGGSGGGSKCPSLSAAARLSFGREVSQAVISGSDAEALEALSRLPRPSMAPEYPYYSTFLE